MLAGDLLRFIENINQLLLQLDDEISKLMMTPRLALSSSSWFCCLR